MLQAGADGGEGEAGVAEETEVAIVLLQLEVGEILTDRKFVGKWARPIRFPR
jgi:hypothetical protein